MSIPVDELVNVFEFEALAKRKLAPDLYAEVSGGDRRTFERITLRPRLMVDTRKLDLSLDLFGHRHFAPILIGPAALQERFHPDGEAATARGAKAAQATVILTQVSSQGAGDCWAQVGDPDSARTAVQQGAKAICVGAPLNWATVEKIRKAVTVPLVVKGIMSPSEAKAAVQHGANGIVVSNYRGRPDPSLASAIEVLPAIAAEVGSKVPLIVDGGIRRGSDVLKAIALGAKAALVTRPVLWGLTTHGDAGVQRVTEMLQSELARDMAMCGLLTLEQITPSCIRVHRR